MRLTSCCAAGKYCGYENTEKENDRLQYRSYGLKRGDDDRQDGEYDADRCGRDSGKHGRAVADFPRSV